MSSRLHILAQFVWPDDAPTGIYAEHVAEDALARGRDVVLIAGEGLYRAAVRPAPLVPIVRVSHPTGRRERLVEVFREYWAIAWAFRAYVLAHVSSGDVVVATSAPPTTVFLRDAIASRGARAVYWLQDYYPELVRGLAEYSWPARAAFGALWNTQLSRWDRVVKVADNLAYEGANAALIRNWPTLDLGAPSEPVPKTALYSGNLGYGHDVDAFLAGCARLRDEGFRIVVRGDGPGMSKLPPWIEGRSPARDVAEIVRAYWDAEVHLVAAHPKITRAIFPSKLWNSLATGRRIVATGFGGAMADELARARTADFRMHRAQWGALLEETARGDLQRRRKIA